MAKKKKSVYLCGNCGSNKVQTKGWVDPNDDDKYIDTVSDGDEEDNYCNDCEEHTFLVNEIMPASRKKVIGFQVVDNQGGDDIHPMMAGSFCVYSLKQAREMLEDRPGKNLFNEWKLLAIWTGDIEEPTMMFKGDPRR